MTTAAALASASDAAPAGGELERAKVRRSPPARARFEIDSIHSINPPAHKGTRPQFDPATPVPPSDRPRPASAHPNRPGPGAVAAGQQRPKRPNGHACLPSGSLPW